MQISNCGKLYESKQQKQDINILILAYSYLHGIRHPTISNTQLRSVNALKSSTAYLFFWAAFPGYFFYHCIKAITPVPYIGWFSVVLLLCAGLSIAGNSFALVMGKIRTASWPVSLPFALLILIMGASVLLNHQFNREPYIDMEGGITNILTIAWMVALFQIGRSFDFSGRRAPFLLLVIAFALCAWAFFDSASGKMLLPILPGDDSDSANYQGMARSVFCAAVVMIPFLKGRWFRSTMMAAVAAILYLIGSRTELAMLLLIAPVFSLVNFKVRAALAMMAASIVLMGGLMLTGVDILGLAAEYASEDASIAQRSMLLDAGLEGIAESPITGDYLGQVRDFGATGYYIHNALSMWQQFGVISFVLYVGLCLGSLCIGLAYLVVGRPSPHVEVLFYLSLACLVGVATTKSIFWPIPALAWGIAAQVIVTRAAPHRK